MSVRPLPVILLIYTLLAIVTSVRVPLGESPDELDHFLYIEQLVQTDRLPVMSPVYDENVTLEANQPPLYYLTGALLTRWIGWESDSDLPQNGCFDRTENFRPTLYLHTAAEDWSGGWLAFRLVRLLSIFMGACTIWLAYRSAGLIAPEIAPLAAALLAFNPQFIFITASVNNDVLTALLGAAILFVALQKTVDPSPNTRYWQLGLLFGLAAATKLGLLAFGLLGLWLLWRDFGRKTPRHLWQLALPPLLIAGWWYVRNILLYGDPLVWTVHLQAKGAYVSRTAPLSLVDLREFVVVHFQSYFAWFGWLNIQPARWVYGVYAVIISVAIVGCLRQWRVLLRRQWIPVLLAILGTYIALLRYIQTINWSGYQGRIAFSAAAPVAIGLAFGLHHFSSMLRGSQIPKQSLAIIWGVWGSFVLINTLWFAYTDVSASLIGAQESCTIIGEQWELERFAASEIEAGNTALNVKTAGYGERVDTALPMTLRTNSGEIVGSGTAVLNHSRRNISGSADLVVNPATPPSRVTLFIGDDPIGSVKIALPLQPNPTPQFATDALFGDQIRLLGYDLAGQSLTLYWEAAGEMSGDLTRYVHLLDPDQQLIWQDDRAPSYPTGIWAVGEIIVDEIRLPISAEQIAVGWYLPQPFENLSQSDGSARFILP